MDYKELIKHLSENVRGFSEIKELALPVSYENVEIYEDDAKIFVKSKDKISFFYTQKNLISNFELLKRILFLEGIEINSNDTKDILKMQIACKKILGDK